MALTLHAVDPLTFPEWDTLVRSLQGYSAFHSSAWARVLHDSYGFTPCYILIRNESQPAGLIPLMETGPFPSGRRGIGLPFTDCCEPLFRSGEQESSIIPDLIEYARVHGWRSLEIRGGRNLFRDVSPSCLYYGHLLALTPDIREHFRKLRGSTKRNIKHAITGGVTASVSNSCEALKEFYYLHCRTRKRHGAPPQPWDFFKNLQRHLLSQDGGLVFTARYEERCIASAICVHFGRHAYYKYAASDRQYQHLRANNLIVWEIIKHYATRGYASLHLGRTETTNVGLLQFKNGWGCTIQKICYYTYDVKKALVRAEEPAVCQHMAEVVFRKCPLFFLRALGTLFYRYVA